MFKNQKGITLIALVITIIVLLILAGITIALITSNDSAPTKAAQAKVEQTVGGAKDTVMLNAADLMTEYYENKYVKSVNGANVANPKAYIIAQTNAAANADPAPTRKLFDNVSGVAAPTLAADGTFVLNSTETVSVDGGTKTYWVKGTVQNGGTIEWTTGQWAASNPFTNV